MLEERLLYIKTENSCILLQIVTTAQYVPLKLVSERSLHSSTSEAVSHSNGRKKTD